MCCRIGEGFANLGSKPLPFRLSPFDVHVPQNRLLIQVNRGHGPTAPGVVRVWSLQKAMEVAINGVQDADDERGDDESDENR